MSLRGLCGLRVGTILSHPQSLLALKTSAPMGWLSISGPGTDRGPGRLKLKVGLVRAGGPLRHTSTAHTPIHSWWSSSQSIKSPAPLSPHAATPRVPQGPHLLPTHEAFLLPEVHVINGETLLRS